jgi:hypothetical protein
MMRSSCCVLPAQMPPGAKLISRFLNSAPADRLLPENVPLMPGAIGGEVDADSSSSRRLLPRANSRASGTGSWQSRAPGAGLEVGRKAGPALAAPDQVRLVGGGRGDQHVAAPAVELEPVGAEPVALRKVVPVELAPACMEFPCPLAHRLRGTALPARGPRLCDKAAGIFGAGPYSGVSTAAVPAAQHRTVIVPVRLRSCMRFPV